MIARVLSAAVYGIEACDVEVEVHTGNGLPAVVVVGLPDEAVKESRERVKSAIQNSSLKFPARRVTVNLAPADVKKEGPSFDLPMALGILAAEGYLAAANATGQPGGRRQNKDTGPQTTPDSHPADATGQSAAHRPGEDGFDFSPPPDPSQPASHPADFDTGIFTGELSLDGRLRPVRGILPVAIHARATRKKLFLPAENAREAAVVEGVEIFPVSTLRDLVLHLSGQQPIAPYRGGAAHIEADAPAYEADMAEIRGQHMAKRALEVAVAGGHNVLMSGPPGTGKTMLAQRVPTILPPMTYEEALETSKIHSILGRLSNDRAFVRTRPFLAPHHTVSFAGLVGGGTVPRPGQISLAHNGVLFLDELPEFTRDVLESLRQPLEDRRVTISRASATLSFPASFMLIASMNPCPCGYRGDSRRRCRCPAGAVQKYRARISGPLMDRIDLHIDVPALEPGEMMSEKEGEPSAAVRARVEKARALQSARFEGQKIHCNAQMRERHLKAFCALDADCKRLMHLAVAELGISPRAYARIRKVARTIADLDGSENILPSHLAEAIQYRATSLDPAD